MKEKKHVEPKTNIDWEEKIKEIVLHPNHKLLGYSPNFVYNEVRNLIAELLKEESSTRTRQTRWQG